MREIGRKATYSIVVLHLVGWLIISLSSILFIPPELGYDGRLLLYRFSVPFVLAVAFYIAHFVLTPLLFYRHRRWFFLASLLLIVLLLPLLQHLHELTHLREEQLGWMPPEIPGKHPVPPMFSRFVFRDIVSLLLSVMVGTIAQMSIHGYQLEAQRQEMEKQRTRDALENLRFQIRPHFLLNTLNNIYALIAFNPQKAQKALLDLSGLSRSMLYGMKTNSIPIKEEIQFLTDYINLMRLRLNDTVELKVNFDIDPKADVHVAPYVFITLVENAFKHGISSTRPSFIHINITAGKNQMTCAIDNSNYPKDLTDKSGHGIGLIQVERRLKLAYGKQYEWLRGVDEKTNTYYSKILIYDTEMRDYR